MGIVYQTSKWSDMLWKGHMNKNDYARAIIQKGYTKQTNFPEFATDIHTSLYMRHVPERYSNVVPWADNLMNQAEALPEWQTLRTRCQSNGFLSGIATQNVLQSLVGLLPRKEDVDKTQEESQEQGTDTSQSDMRRKLRIACRKAEQETQEAEQAVVDLVESFGLHAGTEPGHTETIDDVEHMRAIYAYTSQSKTVHDIAKLAGRLKRLAKAKKKTTVQSRVGGINGITIGGDISRILPSELASLSVNNTILQLQTLNKVMQRQALQYQVKDKEPIALGPMIVCVDESDSMRYGPIEWARAIAMALLITAHEQNRDWYYIGFNTEVVREHRVDHGKVDIDSLCQMLASIPTGGTLFSPPLRRAVTITESDHAFKKADIVFLTDGYGNIDTDILERLTELRKRGLNVYAIGIGKEANLEMLETFASECYVVTNIETTGIDKAVDILAKV